MVIEHLLNDVVSLPLPDRLQLFDLLHENLRNDPGLASVTEQEKRFLDQRLSEYEAAPEEGSDWSEVDATIDALLTDKAR